MGSLIARGPLEVGEVGSEKTFVDDDGHLWHGDVEIAATAAEINRLDNSVNGALMTPGTGLSTGTGFVYKVGIERFGDIIVTRIYMDLTGLNSGGAAADIIGKDGGTANCHFGQVTAAINGTIMAGFIDVGEAPTGGDPDINLGSGDEATGAENAAFSGLTNDTLLTNSGDLAIGTRVNFILLPAADQYLYLVVGTSTVADYTAGMIVVTLVGVAL